MSSKIVNKASDNIRILSAAMVEKAKSGHPGGAMGGADFINVLYSEFLNFDPEDMEWSMRDRFFLDPGHMSPMLYSILSMTGHYSMEDIKNFRQWGSCTPGHPERDVKRGIENTSGPLGQGHAMAAGSAIAERFLAARFGEWMSHKTYAFISDGGIQEEISQGVGRIAGHLGLNNLIMYFDDNSIQLSTPTAAVTSEDTAKKYEAWGWKVISINGNDQDEIRSALKTAVNEKEKPVLIIGKTIMGKGCVTSSGECFENQPSTHGQPISGAGACFDSTIRNLGGDPDNPFQVYPEVAQHYKEKMAEKTKYAQKKKMEQKEWEKKNPELAAKLNSYLAGDLPQIDYSKIEQKENIASRAASGNVLAHFAKNIDNIIVASADLANSDKTDSFLKNSKPLVKNDFSGAFLHAGVSELSMAAIANGIALHGGIFVACGTFFIFSDYMKPAVRLSALMELPVKFIWTHDAFRVGEDGPTHQPVEQEAQIRLMEQLRNHSGKRSMLVLRPADSHETTVAWKMAMENNNAPTGIILSRQNINDIPVDDGVSKYEAASKATKGAYVVKQTGSDPDVILVANGSEVTTLVEATQMLEKEKNVNIRVVSIISEALFRDQPEEYQKEIIPGNVPILGLTAGLPASLNNLVGQNGFVFGLEHFGYSAPVGVLNDKFGFTPEKVKILIDDFMNK